MEPKRHWDEVYSANPATGVSWYQREARVSLDLIARVAGPDAAVFDVGGGASTLVDGQLDRGYRDLTVLDIAAGALDAARARLGGRAADVTWIAADVLRHPFVPRRVDVWHDRAVFHFLTSAADRRTYVAQVSRAVRPGGHVIVATFSSDGPLQCSGLDVCRYTPEALHAEFGGSFQLLDKVLEDHVTPGGRRQRFQYCLCALSADELSTV